MSNIRIMGIVLGLALAGFAILYFRGKRWSRGNFVTTVLIAIALLVVSVDPESLNVVRDVLAFSQFEYGRILALITLSILLLVFLTIHTKMKVDALMILFDRYMRADVLREVEGPYEKPPPNAIVIVIPALNEAENLRVLLPKIPKTIFDLPIVILVVNDGSLDATRDVALSHGCWVANLPVNRGQGAASRVGYDFLIRHDVLFGVTMDADNQHEPSNIKTLVEPLVGDHCDLVIGSRILGSADRESLTRFFGIVLFSRLINLLTGLKITDCSSGFKAFNVRAICSLDLRQDQFQSSEVLIAAAKRGLRVREVPVHISRRGHGQSRKGRDFAYAFSFLKAVANTWWR